VKYLNPLLSVIVGEILQRQFQNILWGIFHEAIDVYRKILSERIGERKQESPKKHTTNKLNELIAVYRKNWETLPTKGFLESKPV
jgi:hypothetical protein